MISGQQPQPPALTETISGRIQGSKAYQSSGLCSGLLFLFGDMIFVIILMKQTKSPVRVSCSLELKIKALCKF